MQEDNIHEEQKRPLWRKALRAVLIFLLSLILLILLVLLAFQFEIVQDWGAKKAAAYLSSKTGAVVQVGSFRLDPFRHLVLEDLLVEDLEKDTLFYSKFTEIKFEKPITSLFDRRLFGTDITIRKGKFHIKREKGELLNNLQELMGDNPYEIPLERQLKELAQPFDLNSDQIFLEAFCFINEDRVKGKLERYCVDEAIVVPDHISFLGPVLSFDDLYINQPVVEIQQFQYDSVFLDSINALRARSDTMYYYAEGIVPPSFRFETDRATLQGGQFHLINHRIPARPDTLADNLLDWSNLRLFELNADLENISIGDYVFSGRVNQIGFVSATGFKLDTLSSDQFFVSPDSLHALDMIFRTPQSRFWADAHLDYSQYADFQAFEDKVFMNIRFGKGKLLINDLISFVPDLAKVNFFEKNKNKQIFIDGRLLGTVNTLIGQDLELAFGNKTRLVGNFDSRNLAKPGKELMHFNLENFVSSVPALRELIPDFSPPEKMNRLGRFQFEGRFDGYLSDFVAYGSLKTELGSAEMDMRMDLSSGKDRAAYSGSLELNNFDLASYSANPNFGKVSFVAEVKEGQGMTLDNLQARLEAEIRSFDYKGYTYRNALLMGEFQKNTYQGFFEISEENIELHFDGRVLIHEKDPQFDVVGQLDHINLGALNISKDPITISANFKLNIIDPDIDELEGSVVIHDLVVDGDSIRYGRVDSLKIAATVDEDASKHLLLNSSHLNVRIDGYYRLLELHKIMAARMWKYHPSFAEYFELERDTFDYSTNVTFELDLDHSSNFTRLFSEKLDTIKDVKISGYIENNQKSYRLEASFPEIHYDNFYFERFFVLADGSGEYSNMVLSLDGAQLGPRLEVNPFTLFLDLRADTIDFTANTANFETFLDNLNIEGEAFLVNGKWQLEFLNSTLQLLGDEWTIRPDNYLRLGKSYIRTHNLAINNGPRTLRFESIDDQGLEVQAEGLELSLLEGVVQLDQLDFTGLLEGRVRIPDLYGSLAVTGDVSIDSFAINGDPYGDLDISSELINEQKKLVLDISIDRGTQQLTGGGYINLPDKKLAQKGTLALSFDIRNYPMDFLEYFITSGIRNTVGKWNGYLDLEGSFDQLRLAGEMRISEAATTVEILGTRYFIDDETVGISSDLVDLNGVILRDKYGNTATINGGLTHYNFADFGLNARIRSGNILVLNTTVADNPVYYGHCTGSVDARFSGSFKLPVIVVDAENRNNTVLNIRVDEEVEKTGLNYIEFRLDSTSRKGDVVSEPDARGVDFTLNMSATPEAQVRIIFDEDKRDIIEGNGNGYLSLHLDRSGELTVFGDYTINSGEYLFTNALSVIEISKPFTVLSGSTLQWTGDPFNAIIDIQAVYRGLSAPPYNFIQEYLTTGANDPTLVAEARNPTDIELVLYLTNTLQQPDINFNIRFPDLTGQLETLVERKLEELRFDQNQLNMQAAALLTFRDFMPSGITRDAAPRLGVQVLANTLSEYLTNQISYYLTNLFERALEDVSFIDNYEFDFGFVLPSGEYIQQGTFDAARSEIILGNRFNLFSERLEVNLKGNIVNESVYAPGGYFKPYAALEYILTPNRRWRLRVYTQSDIGPQGVRRNKHGIGITFRKEFNSIDEINRELRKKEQAIRQEDEEKPVDDESEK